jgi:hypothetical protein
VPELHLGFNCCDGPAALRDLTAEFRREAQSTAVLVRHRRTVGPTMDHDQQIVVLRRGSAYSAPYCALTSPRNDPAGLGVVLDHETRTAAIAPDSGR